MVEMYSAKDLCAIIKACHVSGVSELTIGDMKIGFGSQKWVEFNPHPIADEPTEITKPEPNSFLSKEEVEYQLAIDDPVAWEQAQLEGGQDEAI